MENSNKIKTVSNGALKAIKIARIIAITCAILTAIFGITLIVLTATDVISDYVGKHLDDLSKATISSGDQHGFIQFRESYKIVELYNNRQLNDFLYDIAAEILSGTIILIITSIILSLFKKLFIRLNESESPFSNEIAKDLRVVFIVITIMVFLNSIIMGIIVGFSMYCFYFIYKRGVELQKESDETV